MSGHNRVERVISRTKTSPEGPKTSYYWVRSKRTKSPLSSSRLPLSGSSSKKGQSFTRAFTGLLLDKPVEDARRKSLPPNPENDSDINRGISHERSRIFRGEPLLRTKRTDTWLRPEYPTSKLTGRQSNPESGSTASRSMGESTDPSESNKWSTSASSSSGSSLPKTTNTGVATMASRSSRWHDFEDTKSVRSSSSTCSKCKVKRLKKKGQKQANNDTAMSFTTQVSKKATGYDGGEPQLPRKPIKSPSKSSEGVDCAERRLDYNQPIISRKTCHGSSKDIASRTISSNGSNPSSGVQTASEARHERPQNYDSRQNCPNSRSFKHSQDSQSSDSFTKSWIDSQADFSYRRQPFHHKRVIVEAQSGPQFESGLEQEKNLRQTQKIKSETTCTFRRLPESNITPPNGMPDGTDAYHTLNHADAFGHGAFARPPPNSEQLRLRPGYQNGCLRSPYAPKYQSTQSSYGWTVSKHQDYDDRPLASYTTPYAQYPYARSWYGGYTQHDFLADNNYHQFGNHKADTHHNYKSRSCSPWLSRETLWAPERRSASPQSEVYAPDASTLNPLDSRSNLAAYSPSPASSSRAW